MDCSPPGSSVQRILWAGILEWDAMPSSRGIFPTQGWNPCLRHQQGFFTTSTTWEALGIKQIEAKLEFGIISLLEMLDLTECAFKFVT